MKIIFKSPYIQVGEKDGKFYALFDSGELGNKLEKQEITSEEVKKVQESEEEAYKVLIKYDNQKMGLI